MVNMDSTLNIDIIYEVRFTNYEFKNIKSKEKPATKTRRLEEK